MDIGCTKKLENKSTNVKNNTHISITYDSVKNIPTTSAQKPT